MYIMYGIICLVMFMTKYKVGDIITGCVTGIEDYGIFLSFGDHCSGLIHISEISNSFVKNVSDYAEMNSKMEAMILGCDSDSHFKLSLKALQQNSKKKVLDRIVETNQGFKTLSESLDNWIHETIEEIDKKSKKK